MRESQKKWLEKNPNYARSYFLKNKENIYNSPSKRNKCPNCLNKKDIKAQLCMSCSGVNKSGNKSPYFKGGYENHLWHARNRRVKQMNVGGSHTLEQWNELKEKFSFMCLCCKRCEPEIKLTEDHIIPLSKGGNNDIINIQPLCKSCNSRKYNNIINFIESLEKIIVTEN